MIFIKLYLSFLIWIIMMSISKVWSEEKLAYRITLQDYFMVMIDSWKILHSYQIR